MYIYTYKYILFLGDVEQKQIYQTSWKREGRRTAIQHPELPRLSRLLSVPPARSRLFEDATSRSARTQHPRKGVSVPSPPSPPTPAPSNQGAGGGMLGAGMQGCQATAASPCPVRPPPLPSLRGPPPGTGLRSCPRCRRS